MIPEHCSYALRHLLAPLVFGDTDLAEIGREKPCLVFWNGNALSLEARLKT